MAKNSKHAFSFIAESSADTDQFIHTPHEGQTPILSIKDNIIFPGTVLPINIVRDASVKALRKVTKGNQMVAIFTQKDAEIEHPKFDDLYPYGVMGKVVHSMKLPDGSYSTLIQAFNRVELGSLTLTKDGLEGFVYAKVDVPASAEEKTEYNTMLNMLKSKTREICEATEHLPPEFAHYLENLMPSPFMVNIICSYLPIETSEKYELLHAIDEKTRLESLLQKVNHILHFAYLKQKIERKTQSDLNQQQKEYFLMQEIKNIQKELGDHDEVTNQSEDVTRLTEQASKKKWSEKIAAIFTKEVSRLKRINLMSPDYNVQLNYLQTMLQLPWDHATKDSIKLKTAQRVLNHDHYGMEKVKERILEHLAVLKLNNNLKSPIICLYGPPGVGKTSLGKSIARALKRNYVRISLGGVYDESEIRGHRRTYVGAMPGRILKGMIKAESANPVFILDEIDKISTSNFNGDPSSALLEVLDPEQNNTFHDNFLDIDYDLSKVMFIATANNVHAIPRPLLDRMELIEVSGYITEEKIEIAKRHLIPKKKEENGLANLKKLKIGKPAIEFLIEKYTRESGVRGLEKQIDKIFRKLAYKIALDEQIEEINLTPSDIETLIGKPIYTRDVYQGNKYAGVVTGLAWTSVGGEILFIETSLSRGKGSKLTLTGNLGKVMKESAVLALQYIKAHHMALKIDTRIFDHYNFHIHVPEGAIPKDGPSAGVTMATSIASALTQRKVREHLAMTGEITLRGKVLPVGGIKEKILAAKRAGITDIILCKENKKNIEEIPEKYLKGISFHYVDNILDVWKFALTEQMVENPIEFTFDKKDQTEEKA